ncbi:LPS translocon maturation chaperone LptM [Thorsellia anophelis]|uniref:LPS-assembly lipoprotein LptM n=1 Tax=Thorsellia anophelis DSM 18579 TaxID=1123402 RepID=A0A1I0B1Z9_9GAMM|nr:lipoprotein [Thorsellia anophelis]SET00734.1 hypothetical protein SAMN02583745_01109 [Thorsellia anophelis DSM 18579]
MTQLKTFIMCSVICLSLTQLAGCGLKGPLYVPTTSLTSE